MWKDMSEAAQRKEKQKCAIEKPKFDDARRLRGIYIIDPADAEYKVSKTRGEIWKFRCQQQCFARSGKERTRKLVAILMLARQKYACIVEADESSGKRLEGTLHKDHEDHIAGKGINSLNHYNIVHK